jgi:hypothetical protein
LLNADPVLAAEAAVGYRDDPRPLVSAAAYEDAGPLLPDDSRGQAVEQLTEALSLYAAAGADFDIARVRALLRERGVRRVATGTVRRPARGPS